jgi:hypothetical protein
MWRCSSQPSEAVEFYNTWCNWGLLTDKYLGPGGWLLSSDPADAWLQMQPMDSPCYIIMHIRNESLGYMICRPSIRPAQFQGSPQAWSIGCIRAEDVTWMELHLHPPPPSAMRDTAEMPLDPATGAVNTAEPSAATAEPPAATTEPPAATTEQPAATFEASARPTAGVPSEVSGALPCGQMAGGSSNATGALPAGPTAAELPVQAALARSDEVTGGRQHAARARSRSRSREANV